MKNEIVKQERYLKFKKDVWSIRRKLLNINGMDDRYEEVVCVIDRDKVTFDKYVEEIRNVMGDFADNFTLENLSFEYQCSAFVIIKKVYMSETTFTLSVKYEDDSEFLYFSTCIDGVAVLDTKRDIVGWRDLSDDDTMDNNLYDFFLNPDNSDSLLRYRKPDNVGDYSDQTPTICNM